VTVLRLFAFAILFASSGITLSAAGESYPKLQLGDSWTYRQIRERHSIVNGPNTVIFSVAYESKPGLWVIDSRSASAPTSPPRIEHTAAKTACIVDILGGRVILDGARCDSELVNGQTWRQEASDSDGTEKLNFRIVGREVLEISAGRFEVVRIELESLRVKKEDGNMVRQSTIYWYAESVRGMVKVERKFFNTSGELDSKIVETLDAHTAR
jgi:hypothetical protein